ncbi:hypothetical protein [Paractinoplanes maris]|uniref:hypothetical protein n=1 Tax=Paractinoplanes maris TaxID=1734446 RepID=UPI00201FC407|nr:hypothetical protein [Actinoplanes maris]
MPRGYRFGIAVLVIAFYELFIAAIPRHHAVIVSNVVVAVVTALCAVACGWFAVRSRGPERRWRALAAAALVALATGQGIWMVNQLTGPPAANSPSPADLAYLAGLPVGIAALVVIARHASRPVTAVGDGRARLLQEVRLILDGLLVVVSVFLLAWMTTLRTVLEQESSGQLSLVLAVWYPFGDALLIALVLLVHLTRSIPRRNLRQLSLIGSGLTALALSDLVFSYYLAGGIAVYPFITDIGYLVSPLLIAWAAAIDAFEPARPSAHSSPRPDGRLSAAVAYLPLVLVTVFLSGKVLSGTTLTAVEAVGAVSIFVLVAVREAVTFATVRLETAPEAIGGHVLDLANAPLGEALPGPASELDQHLLSLTGQLREQIERAQRSSNRVAWWTFSGGVVLGALGNVVVAVVMG